MSLMTETVPPVHVAAALPVRPGLENGDRMDHREFHRRFELRPDIKKAELIEGIVYMSSPATARHGRPQSAIVHLLMTYQLATPGVECLDNVTVLLSPDDEPMPDALLRLEERCGGRSRIDPEHYVDGAPELVVEIAASTVSKDLHARKRAYRRAGVREYLVWRTEDRAQDWFILENGRYRTVAPDAAGVIESKTFTGLRLAVGQMVAGDLAGATTELNRGLAGAAHREFAARLASSTAG